MLFGAELEGGIGLEPTRLGSPIVARGDGGADLLQERRDDVEVGLGVIALPFLRIGRVEAGERFRCGRLDGLRSRDPRCRARCRRASSGVGRVPSAPLWSRRRRCARDMTAGRQRLLAAPSRKVIASWISIGTVTVPPATPRAYSIGTSPRNRVSWPARRACSAGARGAARKASRSYRARSVTEPTAAESSSRCRADELVEQPVEALCRRRATLGDVGWPDDQPVATSAGRCSSGLGGEPASRTRGGFGQLRSGRATRRCRADPPRQPARPARSRSRRP